MTTCLGESCSFGLPRVPFVNCGQFMYLVIFLLVLRAGCGIWLYQFLIIAYLFTFRNFWSNSSTAGQCRFSFLESLRRIFHTQNVKINLRLQANWSISIARKWELNWAWYGPRQANLVLIAYASSEGSGEPAHPRSLARTFAARSYKQWVKRNLQTESQIPGPSERLGMRSQTLSWRNARRHKFAWRGSYEVVQRID